MSRIFDWRKVTLVAVAAFLSACGGGGDSSSDSNSISPPLPYGLVSVSPTVGATGVALNATISVTANTTLNAATLTSATFSVAAVGGGLVTGVISVSGSTATFTPTLTLADTTQYIATITTGAKNTAGAGLANDFSWTFNTVTVPGAPTIGTASAGDQAATISFTPPASDGGATITIYTATSNPTGITATGPASPIVFPFGTLANGTPYTFTVTASNIVGTGPPSAPSDNVTPSVGAAPPGAPTFGAPALPSVPGNGQATVNFNAPASSGTPPPILSYTVTARIGGAPTAITASGGGTSIVVPGLTNGTAYTFTVVAFNSSGPGVPSAASGPLTPAGLPGAPTGASASASAPVGSIAPQPVGQATVTFSAPASNGGSAITGYTVTSNPGGGVDSNAGTINGLSHVITGLIVGTPYIFTVTATNGVPLTGPPSTPSNSVTPIPATTVPNAPAAPVAVGGNAQATVTFTPLLTAPSNGGSPVISYTVTSSPGGLPASGAASPIVVPGLTNGVAYTFTVRATNSVGTGAASGPSNSVTPATAPGAPTGASAAAGNGLATVAFSAPASNGGSAITGYTVTSNPGGFTGSGATSPIVVSGLTNGVAFTFTVTATNGVPLTGPPSASTVAVTPTAGSVPPAPTAASATAGNALAAVTFTPPVCSLPACPAITGYTVTSNPGGGIDANAGNLTVPRNITGLTNGTAYSFTVTATNSLGSGPASAASNAVIPATVPGAPTAVSAIAGNLQATVSFTPPISNGGAAIVVYTVTSSPGGITASGANSPMVVNGLTNAQPYTFTVTASNSVGTGPSSVASGSVTPNPAATVPGAPTMSPILAAAVGNTVVTVTLVAGSTGGDPITGFTVTSNPPGGVDANAGNLTLPRTITGLTNGTAYTFAATATNTVGTGPASGASNTVTPATLPGAPNFVSATAGNAQATVNFVPPASNGGATITTYTVTCTPACPPLRTGAASPIVITGLTNLTPYFFTVAATNSVGMGPSSAASNSVTPDVAATVPGPPTGANATAGNAQATVTFSAPGSNGGSPILGYTVISSPGGFAASIAGAVPAPVVVSGLANGTTYTFVVLANNSIGNGPLSGASNAVTPATLPGRPTAASAIAGNAQATVSFTPPASDGGSAITAYTVTSSPGGFIGTGAASPILVTGLANGTAYTFTVTANNSVGTGLPTLVPSSPVTPTSATVPGAPTGASATAGNAQATVSFTAGPTGGSAITGFTVTSNPGGGIDANAGNLTTPRNITGLTNGVAYTFTVTATNAVGVGVPSAASNSVTPVGPPGAPTAVNAIAGNQSATISFTPPASNGGAAITTYTVTSSPGTFIATGATSPITYPALSLPNGIPVTFTVTATNGVPLTGPPSLASNSVTPSALPPTCSPTVPVVAGAISLRAQAARSSGISPLSVFFDATATTSSATTRPFHDIEYRWAFGDPIGGQTWSNGSRAAVSPRNSAKGPVAGHVFEPGAAEYSSGFVTRNVTLTAFDGTDTVSCSIPITISDPDNATATPEFAAARTTCFSTTTDFTGCPAGANQVITSNFATVTNSATSGNIVRRLLMRRGHTFLMSGSSGRLVAPGPGILGAFGPPGPNPIVRATANNTILQMSSQSTPTFADWRVMDIELDGQGIANIVGVEGGGGGNQLTFLRMSIHDAGTGMQFIDGTLDTHNSSGFPGHTLWDQQTVQDTTILRSNQYGMIHGARRFSFLGNLLGDMTSGAQHIHRPGFIAKGVFSNNTYRNQAVNGAVVKMHAQGFSNPPGVTAPGLFTEQVVVSDNLYAGGSNSSGTMMIIGPTSASLDERLRNIIVERNWFFSGPGNSNAVTLEADEVTFRNNLCDQTRSLSSQTCVSVGRAGAEPPHTNTRIFQNSLRSASNIFYIGITVNAGTSLVTLQSNVASAPFSGGPSFVFNGSGSPIVDQNNVMSNNPGFVGANVMNVPFGANTDFNLTGGSIIRNVGPTFPAAAAPPVFEDFFGTARPVGGATDRGATEQ